MNWHKQTEEMIHSWTETQRRLVDQWLDSMQGVAPGAETLKSDYHRQIDAWEEAVREVLRRQQEMTDSMQGATPSTDSAPELAKEWLDRSQEMMQSWTDTQMRFMQEWVEHMGNQPSTKPKAKSAR